MKKQINLILFGLFVLIIGGIVVSFWNASITPPQTTLTVSADPAGATLFIDNLGPFTLPYATKVSPGPHAIQVIKLGYQEKNLFEEINPGENKVLSVNLSPVSPNLLYLQRFPTPNDVRFVGWFRDRPTYVYHNEIHYADTNELLFQFPASAEILLFSQQSGAVLTDNGKLVQFIPPSRLLPITEISSIKPLSISPTGTYILFGSSPVTIFNSHSRSIKTISAVSLDKPVPSWTQNEDTLYLIDKEKGANIYEINPSTQKVNTVSPSFTGAVLPPLLPDQNLLAYSNGDVYGRQFPLGTQQYPISFEKKEEFDFQTIAIINSSLYYFTRAKNGFGSVLGVTHIYFINDSLRTIAHITTDASVSEGIDFSVPFSLSPDGKTLIFVSNNKTVWAFSSQKPEGFPEQINLSAP